MGACEGATPGAAGPAPATRARTYCGCEARRAVRRAMRQRQRERERERASERERGETGESGERRTVEYRVGEHSCAERGRNADVRVRGCGL